MAVTNAAVSFRTVEHIKAEAFDVIAQYGLTPSQVFNIFLTQIAKTKTIPVDLNYLRPNERTLAAIDELENGNAQSFYISPEVSAGSFTQSLLCEKQGKYAKQKIK
ncbi:MAG: type II toxin-antitoxin system RelB/DinJ family antitoxin [Pasteurellaceae bacterium]|nr:type II toxin-antitoxin system RelB/DinJ family antitoxin [Pasteurellaceae bacterium]